MKDLAFLFLRLGCTAFGGPAAHIAMMEDEVVRRRKWLSHDEFLDMLGATNLIPGPNSTEMAIHIGHKQGGWPGLIVAGVCFVVPAMLIVWALAWVYVRFGALPHVGGILYGVKPVVVAVVAQALWGLGRTAIKTRVLGVLCAAAVIFNALGVNELAILLGGGLVSMLLKEPELFGKKSRSRASLLLIGTFGSISVTASAAVAGTLSQVSLTKIFLIFAKIGSVLFGSGYVLLAFLKADLVDRLHWLTGAQLMDAIAVGQFTPGPVFTTATFIGYLLAGNSGALLATLGIFLPAFVFVAISGLLIPRLRRSPRAGALLDGVNVASWALMAVVAWQLGRSSLVDVPTGALALLSALLLIRLRVNSVWLILVGGFFGFLVK